MVLEDIVIVGAGGLGKDVLFLLREINKVEEKYHILGFVDDSYDLKGKYVNDVPVLGDISFVMNYKESLNVAVCFGNSDLRRKIVQKLSKNPNLMFPNIIAPDLRISDYVSFGMGCILCFSIIITVDVTISDFVLICNSCNVGHDSQLGSYSTLYPSVTISGNVIVGHNTEIGIGTQVIQGKTIGNHSVIGAGAVVVNDIPQACTAIGVPAKPIKFLQII